LDDARPGRSYGYTRNLMTIERQTFTFTTYDDHPSITRYLHVDLHKSHRDCFFLSTVYRSWMDINNCGQTNNSPSRSKHRIRERHKTHS